MPRDNREWRFQSWVDRFLDRVVMPPMFTTGVDHASQMSQNARARMAARGIRSGIPDVFVCQAPSAAIWIELKRGSSLTLAQVGVHNAMRTAGQFVATCGTMDFVVRALRSAGFKLHPNADELAREYELRVEAKEKAPATPRKASKPRSARVSPSRIARAERARRLPQ